MTDQPVIRRSHPPPSCRLSAHHVSQQELSLLVPPVSVAPILARPAGLRSPLPGHSSWSLAFEYPGDLVPVALAASGVFDGASLAEKLQPGDLVTDYMLCPVPSSVWATSSTNTNGGIRPPGICILFCSILSLINRNPSLSQSQACLLGRLFQGSSHRPCYPHFWLACPHGRGNGREVCLHGRRAIVVTVTLITSYLSPSPWTQAGSGRFLTNRVTGCCPAQTRDIGLSSAKGGQKKYKKGRR
ncbi:hypothetical protein VTK56DRAFT_9864 [Thermocarpiscus australiensis]